MIEDGSRMFESLRHCPGIFNNIIIQIYLNSNLFVCDIGQWSLSPAPLWDYAQLRQACWVRAWALQFQRCWLEWRVTWSRSRLAATRCHLSSHSFQLAVQLSEILKNGWALQDHTLAAPWVELLRQECTALKYKAYFFPDPCSLCGEMWRARGI